MRSLRGCDRVFWLGGVTEGLEQDKGLFQRDRDHNSLGKIPQTAGNQNDDFTARSALHAAHFRTGATKPRPEFNMQGLV